VLGAAIASSGIANLPAIKELDDQKKGLRRLLSVEIMKDANLIRVALGLSDGEQAASIVNAVVVSYLGYRSEYTRGSRAKLRASLVDRIEKVQNWIEELRTERKTLDAKVTIDPVRPPLVGDVPGKEADSTKPTFTTVTLARLSPRS
jgi:hypothetical protein